LEEKSRPQKAPDKKFLKLIFKASTPFTNLTQGHHTYVIKRSLLANQVGTEQSASSGAKRPINIDTPNCCQLFTELFSQSRRKIGR
jgi:hypothetical protein